MGSSSSNESEENLVTEVVHARKDLSPDAHHAPITASSSKPSSSYDDLAIKIRFKSLEESTNATKRPRFASLEDEEDYFYYLKIQEYYQHLREKFASEDEEKNKKKKRKITKRLEREPVVVTKRLERFIESDMINGSDVKLVIQKTLFKSDLKRDQNRLNIPINQLETQDFLTDDEKQVLENGKDHIEVGLVGPTLQMYDKPMVLKRWKLKSTYNYVLRTNWNHFVEDHKDVLKKGAKIQLWSFRKDRKLCFAITCVDSPPADDGQNDVD